MKLETFFEKFEVLAEMPGAVGKLRELVLELAVTGKLVGQDPLEESGEILLAQVKAERTAAVTARLIGPMKPLPPVEENEQHFAPPPGWASARLIDTVMEIQTGPFGSSLHKSDYQHGGTPVVNPASMKDGKIVPIPEMAIGKATLDRLAVFQLRAGDIVMARRGEMGRCAIVTSNEHGWLCGTGSLVLRMPRCLFAPYIAMLIGSPLARAYLGQASVGTTMQNLNQSILARMPVGVPPLAEQKRIVAKVCEFMALCDRLEAQQQERETRHTALARASLAQFADAPTPANLSAIFHPSFAITPAELRKSILTLAVQGKLVSQDPSDVPAETESECDAPFDIPSNWRWKPLGRMGLCKTGKTPPTGDPTNYGLGFPFVGPGQITLSGRFTASEKSITRQGLESGTEANAGDILMVCIGGSIGKAAICREPIVFNQQINSVRLQRELPEFVYLAVTADYFQEQVLANASGSATPIINKGKWEQLPIPLPPLAEQLRIVAKVEQLMGLVDALESKLAASCATAQNILTGINRELGSSP